MVGEVWAPDFDGLVSELRTVRKAGLTSLRRMAPRLPLLDEVTRRAGLTAGQDFEPSAVEDLLRRAADTFDGGIEQDAVEHLLGLAPGWKMRLEGDRRRRAAEVYGIQADSFRKKPEQQVIEQMAEGILAVLREASMRQARVDMEQRRHPADSRLAVQWVERFEAYYRIWTPLWALAGDLLATLTTRQEDAARFPPWDPDGQQARSRAKQSYDPTAQAAGYARYALARFADFQLELRRFMTRHGGLWLCSDVETEETVADAVYTVGWCSPFNEDEDAYLRRTLADARHQEHDHFAQVLAATVDGERMLTEWIEFIFACRCADVENGDERDDDGVPPCRVHRMMLTARTYCDLIDNDWLKIADWYRPDATYTHGTRQGELYEEYVRRLREAQTSTGE